MYAKIKDILIKVLPPKIILKNEFFFRKLYSLFYIGKSVYCNICNKHFSSFLKAHMGNSICPRCGSLARHRRLWQIMNHVITTNTEDKILDFSPSRIILKKLKAKHPNYLSTDYLENFLVDRKYDITELPDPSNSFHCIICYHILEHVENDHKAISELYRVLKEEGSVIIQTPFKDGNTYENPDIISKEERLIHFGQEDHVRVYSINGLRERLQSVGFKIKILEYNEEENNIHGFESEEYVLIATK